MSDSTFVALRLTVCLFVGFVTHYSPHYFAVSVNGSSSVPRAIPKLVAYDRKRAREQPKDDSNKFPYNEWRFFEEDSFEVSKLSVATTTI